MDAALFVLLSVTQYLFLFERERVLCDDSCAITPPLLFKYYEAKIQMLSVL